jgi:hypothetical protein
VFFDERDALLWKATEEVLFEEFLARMERETFRQIH